MNASVETWLNYNVTFNADVVYSPWQSIDGYPFTGIQVVPEIRYYINSVFDGLYVGGFASLHSVKLPNWSSLKSDQYHKGSGYGFGASVGYQFFVTNKWNLDLYVGYGWAYLDHKTYDKRTKEQTRGWHGTAKWMPMKIGVALSYAL